MNFEGKVILLTGAGSGIGLALLKKILESGGKVISHYHSEKEGIERLRKGYESHCLAVKADFSKSSEVKNIWEEGLGWSGGRVDILINNAAEVTQACLLEDLSEEAWDRTFQVNLKAPLLLSQLFFKAMKKQGGGRIINLSSVGIKFGGGANTAHYSVSKAGLEALSKSLAKAGAQYNILVNCVRAGVTDTDFHKKAGKGDLQERTELIPLKRAARPEEIADSILFLASEKSAFTTGSVMTVAGGE